MAVQELSHAMRAAEQDPALPEDVRRELSAHRGWKAVRRADADRPTQCLVQARPRVIVFNRERSVDARSVHLFSLNVEPSYRRAHSLRGHQRDIDVLREMVTLVAEVSEETAMAEAEERSGLHGLEDFGVLGRLGTVGNQEENHIRRVDHLVDFAEFKPVFFHFVCSL
jgi:hypothetical protein